MVSYHFFSWNCKMRKNNFDWKWSSSLLARTRINCSIIILYIISYMYQYIWYNLFSAFTYVQALFLYFLSFQAVKYILGHVFKSFVIKLRANVCNIYRYVLMLQTLKNWDPDLNLSTFLFCPQKSRFFGRSGVFFSREPFQIDSVCLPTC